MNTIISKKVNRFLNIFLILFFLVVLNVSKNVYAAELKLESDNPKISVGDTVSVEVIIDTEGESINVVEGSIGIPESLDLIDVKEISLANSNLSQWVRTPSWSGREGIISFVGGLPGGLNKKSASLFKIYFTAKSSGQITFSPSDIKVYANDGQATQVGVHVAPLKVEIDKQEKLKPRNELQALALRDYTAPANINAELGQDSSLFDGQRFINISAVDSESGLDYFEVKEGNREPVKTSCSYVLQSQDKLEPIIIFAFDKAGNISKKALTPDAKSLSNNNLIISFTIGFVIIILIFLFIIYRRFKKIDKKLDCK